MHTQQHNAGQRVKVFSRDSPGTFGGGIFEKKKKKVNKRKSPHLQVREKEGARGRGYWSPESDHRILGEQRTSIYIYMRPPPRAKLCVCVLYILSLFQRAYYIPDRRMLCNYTADRERTYIHRNRLECCWLFNFCVRCFVVGSTMCIGSRNYLLLFTV